MKLPGVRDVTGKLLAVRATDLTGRIVLQISGIREARAQESSSRRFEMLAIVGERLWPPMNGLRKTTGRTSAIAVVLALAAVAPAFGQARRSPRPPTAARPLSAQQIAKATLPSVVVLYATNSAGDVAALGSGFFIGPTTLVTNAHVIRGASGIYARTVGGERIYRTTASFVDTVADLAVLTAVGANAAPIPPGPSSEVEIGDPVYVVGNPEGLAGTFSDGIVSGFREIAGIRHVQITAPISRGSSGGPVLNAFGQVIGVATSMLAEGQNLNFAVDAKYITDLLNKRRGVATRSAEREAGAHSFDDYMKLGARLRDESRWSEATDVFAQATRLNPSSAEAYAELGSCYYARRMWGLSGKAFIDAMTLDPKAPELPLNVGLCFVHLSDLESALDAFAQAERLDPSVPEVQYSLALTYKRLGRSREAWTAYERLRRLSPAKAAEVRTVLVAP